LPAKGEHKSGLPAADWAAHAYREGALREIASQWLFAVVKKPWVIPMFVRVVVIV
jgi:hypothetical protein